MATAVTSGRGASSDPPIKAYSRLSGRRICDRIADDLAKKIIAGEILPGVRLPFECEASEHLGVSRTIYREAIKGLEARGLLECHARRGTHVLPSAYWHLLDSDVLQLVAEGRGGCVLRDQMFELPLLLEPAVAELTAHRRERRHLLVLTEAIEAMAADRFDSETGRLARRRFHQELFKAVNNPFIESLASTAILAFEAILGVVSDPKIGDDALLVGHKRILLAVEERKPGVARMVTAHLIEAVRAGSKIMNRHEHGTRKD